MKKTRVLCLMAIMLLLLGACSGQTAQTPTEEPKTQENPLTVPTETPPVFGDNLPEGYDPSKEEDQDREYVDSALAEQAAMQYAGATPILINPIDMPTATPRPPLAFSFAPYTASGIGLTFESVAGYHVDESDPNVYILTEPAEQMKDNYSVQITLSISPVTSSYKSIDAKRDLQAKLAEMGKVNYKSWEPTYTAERTLLNKKGHYANYRGVLLDDTIVRGRVHMALLDNNRLFTIHISYPGWYSEDYIKVFTHIRNTLKAI
ncbi:MAG: hypothetical protein ACOX63_04905 [Christensenellales bacterium]|jgi:hypothetical protein